MTLKINKVLVTGGSGFIGSAVVRWILAKTSYQVLIVDKLSYSGAYHTIERLVDNKRCRFFQIDICNKKAITNLLLSENPDAIMHLAAESHVDRSIDGPSAFIKTNIIGTFSLLESVRLFLKKMDANKKDRFRFIHVSTDEVFGSLGNHGKFDENSPYRPRSPYSASKASSDHLVRAWGETYNINSIVTNCSNNYGPYQFPEKLIPLTILNGIFGNPISVYGTGENIRDWLFVDDHACALMSVLHKGIPGETYAIGGDCEIKNIDLIKMICKILDEIYPNKKYKHEELIKFVVDRPGHDFRYAIENQKIKNALGFQPSYHLEDRLKDVVKWYVNNKWWWQPIWEKTYRGKRLGAL